MWGLLLANIMPLSDDDTKNSWNRRDGHMRDLMQRSAGKRGLEVTVGPHGTGSGYGKNWDSIDILDLENSKLPDNTYDFIICNAVLVHARNPFACASEITRVAKIGCELYAETSFFTPFHPVEVWNENMGMFLDGTGDATSHNGRDFGGDYWRYTPMSLAMLFSAFKKDRNVGIFGGGGLSYFGIKDSTGGPPLHRVENRSVLANVNKADRISIIVPSMYRAEQFSECVKRIQETTKGHNVEIVVVVDGRCKDTLNKAAELEVIVVYNKKHLGALASWNRGLRVCTGDPIIAIADDTYCHDGWLEEALKSHSTLPGESGIVGLNPLWDDRYRTAHCNHFLVDRKAIREVLGGVLFYEVYQHFCSDNETFERASRAGRYVASDKAIVEHRHVRLNNAPNDRVYEMTTQYVGGDYALLLQRRAAGFPNNFEAVI